MVYFKIFVSRFYFDDDTIAYEFYESVFISTLLQKDSPDKSFSLSVTPDDSDDDSEEHPKSPTSHHVGSLEEGEELQEDENGLPRLRRASSSSDIDKAS